MAATRILLVEDDGIIRMMMTESLQDEGFDVVEAWDGDEAVRLLNGAETFDIIFTDVRMPGSLDGVDMVVYARRLHPEIPLLVVSGYAPHLMSRLATLEPAAVFIDKPYILEEIVEAVRRLTMSP